MKRGDAERVGRLRSDESTADETARGRIEPADFRKLADLRHADERLVEQGHRGVLDDRDRAILDAALALGEIRFRTIATQIGVAPATVLRRTQRLLFLAGALQRYADIFLDEPDPDPKKTEEQEWKMFKAWMVSKLYYASSRSLKPPEVLPPDQVAMLERLLVGADVAVREIREKGLRPGGRLMVWRGRELVVTDDPPRCLTCGRYLRRAATGRPARYCSERCRSRFRRVS